jgi:hypothetical protein
MDEKERVTHGEFETLGAALKRARKLSMNI